MTEKAHISITTVTLNAPTKKRVTLKLNDRLISIPVDADLFAYFKINFVRQNPSQRQKNEYATVMRLMAAAYLKGCEDGKRGL
jgi:hypothetical protein